MLEAPSPQSPAERARGHARGDAQVILRRLDRLPAVARVLEVAKRVAVGVFSDGFIHAGNLAYLTLMTLFPFFIVTAAVASLFGRDEDTLRAVASFLAALPPSVRDLLRQPIADVLTSRTGWLLWVGAIIGLWTVGSFIETVRDILRRAYGTKGSAPFWHYRLTSMGVIVGAVLLMMVAFAAQVALVAAEQIIYRLFPLADDIVGWIQLGRIIPLLVVWGAVYLLMWTLTPSVYRTGNSPKWPGALFVALWWYGALSLLPVILSTLGGYDRTYGSLAGVIVALLFFWFVGLGFVIGAHLNAALSEPPEVALGRAAKE